MPVFTHFTHDEFVEATHALAHLIQSEAWHPHLLVGVGRGGLAPAVYLSHASGLPMVSIDFSTPIPEFNASLLEALAARTRAGERLLFVEDINDSGQTIAAVRELLSAHDATAENTRFAVLIDNAVSAARVDYRFRTIDRTVTKDWFIFPWEAVAPQDAIAEDAAEVPERIA
jgi:hypoxanthine phosphoribosyltransferase